MLLRVPWRLAVYVLAVAIGASSCSKGSTTGPDAHPGAAFQTTPIVSRTVSLAADGVVADSSTGLTFGFPQGASGTLATATITSAVPAPVAGKGYYVSYDGNGSLSLVFPASLDTTILVYGFGASAATPGDSLESGDAWVSIPPRLLASGQSAFDLPMPFGVASESRARPIPV